MSLLLIAVVVLILVGCLLLAGIAAANRGPSLPLHAHMAKQELRAIRRRTVRQMYEAEARYRREHGDDYIDGSAVEE